MFASILLDLTWREIVQGIPLDAGSIFAYVLLAFIIAVLVYGSRSTGARPSPDASKETPKSAGSRTADRARQPKNSG